MKHICVRYFYKRIGFLFALILLSGSILSAGQNAFTLNVTAGFTHVVKWMRLIPVTVSIQNNTKQCEGKLIVETIKGSAYGGKSIYVKHSQKVILPEGMKQHFSFVVEFWNFAYPLIVKLLINGEVVVLEEVDIIPIVTSKKIILSISDTPFLNFLSHPGIEDHPIQVIYPSVTELPGSASGYDMVDMIVVYDTSLKSLKEVQVSALEKWVSLGNILVIYGKQLSGPLKKFISATITGYTEKKEIPAFAEKYKHTLPHVSGFPLMIINPSGGEILLADNNIPLIIRKTYDQGNIFICSFDFGIYPFTEWAGRFHFWEDILDYVNNNPHTEKIYTEKKFEEESFHAYLTNNNQFPGIRFPVFYLYISLYPAIFILLLFMPGKFLFKGNMSLKWRILLFISVIFTIGGWFLFHHVFLKQDFFSTDIAVISSNPGKSHADMNHYIGLFSLNNRQYTITFPDDIHNVRILYPADETSGSFTKAIQSKGIESIEIESLKTIKNLAPGKWSSLQINTRGKIKFPFKGTLTGRDGLYSLYVENNTNYTIKDTLLLYNENLYPVGNIQAHIKTEKEYTIKERIPEINVLNSANPLIKASIQIYLEPLLKKNDNKTHAYLIGWIDNLPNTPVFTQGDMGREDTCFVKTEIPVIIEKGGKK